MPSSVFTPLLLLLLLLLISSATAKLPLSSHRQTPKNIPSFSFSTHAPVSLPLRVAVVLLGFDGTGQSAVSIDPVQLEEYLYTVLPTRQPHDLNSGHLLHAQYQLWYSVTTIHHKHGDKLYAALAASTSPTHTSAVDAAPHHLPMFDVSIHGHITDVLDELYTDYVQRAPDPSLDHHLNDASAAIFLINPARKRFFPRDARLQPDDSSGGNSFSYRYTSKHSAAAFACWVGSKKYVVADFAAGPVQYGSARDGDGSVAPQMPVWSGGYSDMARLVKVVSSALAHVVAPDVYGQQHISRSIFVPVVAFSDHPPPPPGADEILGHANFDLQGAVTSIATSIPWLRFDTSTATHPLSSNPAVAKALGASLRTVRSSAMVVAAKDTTGSPGSALKVSHKLHLGAKTLLAELRDSESLWSLMVDASAGVLLANSSRICPIFVFSLKDLADPCLIDGRSVSVTLGDGTVMITGSSNAELPFFSSSSSSIASNTNHMSHTVLASLLTASTGLPAPNVRFKGEDGRLHSDYTWSHGFHPFAPFSNNTRLSALVVDAARRSSVLQTLDAAFVKAFDALHLIDGLAAEFLYDPLGTVVSDKLEAAPWVERWFSSAASRAANASDSPLPFVVVRRIHTDAQLLEQAFTAAAAAISSNGVVSAEPHALDAYSKAVHLLAFASVQVEEARSSMRCCKIKHSAADDYAWSRHPLAYLVILLLASSCFYGLHITWASLNNSRNRKASLHAQ